MANHNKHPDYYDTLGIHKTASDEDIHDAYRKLALLYHPDRNPGFKAESERQFKRIQEAFDTLGDPEKRILYDRSLDEEEFSAEDNNQTNETTEQSAASTVPRWWQFYRGSEPYPGDEFFKWTDKAPGWWVVMWGGPYPGDEFFSKPKTTHRNETTEQVSTSVPTTTQSVINILKNCAIGYLLTIVSVAVAVDLGLLILSMLCKHLLLLFFAIAFLLVLIYPVLFVIFKLFGDSPTTEWDWDSYGYSIVCVAGVIVALFAILLIISSNWMLIFFWTHPIGLSVAVIVTALVVSILKEIEDRKNHD